MGEKLFRILEKPEWYVLGEDNLNPNGEVEAFHEDVLHFLEFGALDETLGDLKNEHWKNFWTI